MRMMSKQKSEYAICVREIAKDKELEILRFIKEILKKRNITQYELADRLDFSHSTVNQWLSGNNNMSLNSFLQILEALDLSGVENHLQDNLCKTPIELLRDAEKEMLRHLENFIEYDHWEYIENINNTLISIKKLEELYENRKI